MSIEINDILARAITMFGVDIFEDSKRFKAVLSDFNLNKKDINLLTCITKVGYFSEFVNGKMTENEKLRLLFDVTKDYPYGEIQIRTAIEQISGAVFKLRSEIKPSIKAPQVQKAPEESKATEQPKATEQYAENNEVFINNDDDGEDDTPLTPLEINKRLEKIYSFSEKQHKEALQQYIKIAKKPEKQRYEIDYEADEPIELTDAATVEAFVSCKNEAEKGDPVSQNNLGVMYQEGLGVAKDYVAAVRWYTQAANGGNKHAQQNIAWMLRNGYGTAQDYKKAVEWYLKAADQGNPLAQNNLGWLYQNGLGVMQSNYEAFRWYSIAAEQGDLYAMNNLAFLHEKGLGIQKDFQKAVELYKTSAANGDAQGQNNLGFMYERGYGVPLNYKDAIDLYKQAGEQNYTVAQLNLARVYEIGLGVRKNDETAAHWRRRSASVDDPILLRNTAWCYQHGCGIRKSAYEAERWYSLASHRNDADSQYNLGVLLFSRDASPSERAEALKWIRQSARQGNENAQLYLRNSIDR